MTASKETRSPNFRMDGARVLLSTNTEHVRYVELYMDENHSTCLSENGELCGKQDIR